MRSFPPLVCGQVLVALEQKLQRGPSVMCWAVQWLSGRFDLEGEGEGEEDVTHTCQFVRSMTVVLSSTKESRGI